MSLSQGGDSGHGGVGQMPEAFGGLVCLDTRASLRTANPWVTGLVGSGTAGEDKESEGVYLGQR